MQILFISELKKLRNREARAFPTQTTRSVRALVYAAVTIWPNRKEAVVMAQGVRFLPPNRET